MATINDIAKKAGVSKSTVSYVFSKKRYVSDEIVNRVLAISKELNYTPSAIATSLATKKTNIIGLFLGNKDNKFLPFYGELIEGLTSKGNELGYKLLLYLNTPQEEVFHSNLTAGVEPIDGALIFNTVVRDFRTYEMLENNIPFVLIGNTDDVSPNISLVDTNAEGICYEITKYLIKQNKEEIILINSAANLIITFNRLDGFVKALQESGINFKPHNVYNCDTTSEMGEMITRKALDSNSNISAIIVESDTVAEGVWNVLYERGLTEKINIASLGGENTDKSKGEIYARTNYRQMGVEAMNLLINKIESLDETYNQHIIVDSMIYGIEDGER